MSCAGSAEGSSCRDESHKSREIHESRKSRQSRCARLARLARVDELTPGPLSWIRTIFYWTGVASTLTLFVKAADRFKAVSW